METLVIGLIDDEREKLLGIEEELVAEAEVQAFISMEGSEAIRWVQNHEINLLASDYHFPGADYTGLDILIQAREIDEFLPLVLFTTGVVSREEITKCKSYAIDFYDKKEGDVALTKNLLSDVKTKSLESRKSDLGHSISAHLEPGLIDIIDFMKDDLILELKKIRDQNSNILIEGETPITVSQLIGEIKTLSKIGVRYVKYWTRARSKIRNK